MVCATGLGTLVALKYDKILCFDIYASTFELKKSSKSKFVAKLVATITDFGKALSQKSFF